ncbi:MAG: hypothetical protein ACRDIC_06070 [bacterium]
MNWLWLGLLVAFGLLETAALLNRRDRFQPATYWIRKILALTNRWQVLFWLAVGLWLWLGLHFFVES